MEFPIADPEQMLGLVDEYTLYCFYLGFAPELREKYHSPLRDVNDPDSNPSFSVFENKRTDNFYEYMWKDSGKGISGNIFKLVMILYKYKFIDQAFARVHKDFFGSKEGVERRSTLVIVKPVVPASIRIKSRPFTSSDMDFFIRFGITMKQLEKYRVSPCKMFWMYKDDPPVFCSYKNPTYAYAIYDRYQLYSPFAQPQNKFRHDFSEEYIPGSQQLTYDKPLLIITKSYKDTMLLDRLSQGRFEVVNCRSENTPFNEAAITHFKSKYPYIFTWFDNDGKVRRDFFDFAQRHLEVPVSSGEKDPTDFYKHYGEQQTQQLVNELTRL